MGNVVARTQAVRVLSNPTPDHSDSILTTLLQYPSLISASVTWNRQTLWHLAAQSGHLQLIKALPDAVNHIFHQLRSDRRRRCISKFGQDGHAALRSLVNNPDVRGATPLMVAAYYGHQECICKLLQIGADAWQKVGLCVAMQSPDRLKRRVVQNRSIYLRACIANLASRRIVAHYSSAKRLTSGHLQYTTLLWLLDVTGRGHHPAAKHTAAAWHAPGLH
jgi:hypothetical protein